MEVVAARRVVDVDVDELGAERAAERRCEIAGLNPEDDARAVVEHLEALEVVGARLEAVEGRVGVVPRTVVVTGRVGHVEEDGAGREVEDDRASDDGRCRRLGSRRRR